MIVRLSPLAARDVEAIGDFIARDNPERARSFVEELEDRYRSLGHQPKRFPVAIVSAHGAIRKLTHGPYLIFYIIEDKGVRILRIVHNSRDWAAIFSA